MDRTKVIEHNGDVYRFDEEKHAHTLNGKPLTGVTSLIDKTLSKPALIPWAVKMTTEYIINNCPVTDSIDGVGKKTQVYSVTKEDLELSKKAHNTFKERAGDWGTRVHNACEIWSKTGELPTVLSVEEEEKRIKQAEVDGTTPDISDDSDILPSVLNFVKFIEDNGFKILDVERNVWSKELWIGGIFDLVLEKDGKVYIADIKTSSGIYDSHFIQMGAYYKCILEHGWQKDYSVDEFAGAIVINLKKDGKIATCISSALPSMVETYEAIVTIYRNRDLLDKVTKSINYGTYTKL